MWQQGGEEGPAGRLGPGRPEPQAGTELGGLKGPLQAAPLAFTPQMSAAPLNGLWLQALSPSLSPWPGAPGWDRAGPLWPRRRPGFVLEGSRKWEMAGEADTGSVGLWCAGSDLFFISSRFAEIYENVFLVP